MVLSNANSSSEFQDVLTTQILQGLMAANNLIHYDGASFMVVLGQVFDRQIIVVNGSFPADVFACKSFIVHEIKY